MTKMKCPCKYTYDPAKGDPKQGIAPGTHSNLSTIGFAIGFVLMMVLDVVMG